MMRPACKGILLVALWCGCAPRQVRLTLSDQSSARAVSLLGDTIWTAPVDPRNGPWLITRLQVARAAVSADSMDLDGQLILARRTAETGQVREAVDLLTRTARIHYLSPRVYRTRGELLIWLRELQQAFTDFETAEDLTRGRTRSPQGSSAREGQSRPQATWGVLLEPGSGQDPVVEYTSVQYQIAFHMGLIRYLQGNTQDARVFFTEAAERASSDNDLAQAALWLFFALRRAGDLAQAAELLAAVDTGWVVSSHRTEHQLLLGFKGAVPSDTIRARATHRTGGPERALYSYGIGYMLMATSRTEEGTLWLEQARTIPEWTALAYLAAEADLARLPRAPRRGVSP